MILAGILIQLEIAIGGPLLLLSFIYLVYFQIKRKRLKHFFIFLLILLPLSSYIIFDLRHDFSLTNAMIRYIRGNPEEYYVGFFSILKNRIEYIFAVALPLLNGSTLYTQILSFIISAVYLINYFKSRANHKLHFVFLYFFTGYFLISLKNRYYLLFQHFVGFVPIAFIFLTSTLISGYKKYVVLLFLFLTISNEFQVVRFITDSPQFIGRNEDSWKFLACLAEDVFSGREKEFGYFVFAPDKFAYEPKYTFVYGAKQHPEKQAFYFEKKPVAYVVSAPPPPNDPYMTGDWWTKNSIKINRQPQKVLNYDNGYKVERYELTPTEINIPWDKHEDTGIFFR